LIEQVTPTFDAIGPLCQFDTAPLCLPSSKEGITGTWNPAIINTAASGSVTYTFTPDAGQCATTATIDQSSLTEQVTPTFDQIGPLCQVRYCTVAACRFQGRDYRNLESGHHQYRCIRIRDLYLHPGQPVSAD
jgi:hypothetical protein